MSAPGRPKGEYRSAQHEGFPSSTTTNIARRKFLGSTAAVTGALVFGFHVPFAGEAHAQGNAPSAPGTTLENPCTGCDGK